MLPGAIIAARRKGKGSVVSLNIARTQAIIVTLADPVMTPVAGSIQLIPSLREWKNFQALVIRGIIPLCAWTRCPVRTGQKKCLSNEGRIAWFNSAKFVTLNMPGFNPTSFDWLSHAGFKKGIPKGHNIRPTLLSQICFVLYKKGCHKTAFFPYLFLCQLIFV
jgi:hypothetical protein